MIGWQVNRGWTQAADFFPASRFRDTYARADIVERVLDTLDEGEAVRLANAARPQKAEPAPLLEQLPPVLSILAPADGANVSGEVRIDYLLRSPSGLEVDAVEALIDGRPAAQARGLAPADQLRQCLVATHGNGRVEGALQGCRGSITVSLPPGRSEVGLVARAGARSSEIATVRLTRTVLASGDELLKPKLYALVIGVSDYVDESYRLGFAAKDARDFAAALANQQGGLYGEVTVKLLPDREASVTAIRDGFDWLAHAVTSRDIGIVYLAGHGLTDERDNFYFLAADSDAKRLRATALPRADIADALDALAGKALLFLDASHAGAVAGRRGDIDINKIIGDFSNTGRGIVTFAASTGRQVSMENAAWGNGAFTKAVIEGIGLPGIPPRALATGGKITASSLDLYVTERVKELTKGAQSPVMIRGAVPDFPLAVAR